MSRALLRCIKPHKKWCFYSTVKQNISSAQDENPLAKELYQRIKAKGSITVAEYMRQVLTNPTGGYYMNKDMLGAKGDFITSPELTQMFGEMLAVWCLNEWQKIGAPKPLQIVELGPGRGTLSADLLKIFAHFNALHNVSLSLVEISPYLSSLQAKQLCKSASNVPDMPEYKRGTSHEGIPVRWYRQLKDVPNVFTLLIAHEFFDALPVHKFHRTYAGFREVLIDIVDKEARPKFRYVLANHDTPMRKALLKPDESREHVEVSPDAVLIYQEVCARLSQFGGIALICDYGHNGEGTDTFRAFKQHQQVDPLVEPGTADLTSDVDFGLLRQIAEGNNDVLCFGPVSQKDFLLRIGLEHRFESLSKNAANQGQLDNLKQCYDFLISDEKMGERFKFMALLPSTLKKCLDRFPVVGFT